MIIVDRAEGRFQHRVAAVVVEDGWALLHRAVGDDSWSLPGGRVEMLEPSAAALARELREEVGVEAEVGELLWVVENFFPLEGRRVHELGLYFRAYLPEGAPLRAKERAHPSLEPGSALLYRWFPLEALPSLPLLPSFLSEGLRNPPGAPRHLVHGEREDG